MKYAKAALTLALLLVALFPIISNAQTTATKARDEYLSGRAYLLENNYMRAAEAFSKSIALKPSSEAYKYLGIAYHGLDRYLEAVNALTQAVQGIPNDPEVHYWLAWTHDSIGIEALNAGYSNSAEFPKAETEAREALRLRPNYQLAYWVLADSLYKQGKYREAVSAGERSLALRSDDQATMFGLALAYAQVGRKPEAMQLYNRLVPLDSKYAARLLSRLNEISNNAGTNSARPSSTPPVRWGTVEYYLDEGKKYLDAEKYAEAITSFNRVIFLNPLLAAAHFNVGYCQYELKQYELALPAFQQAATLEPNNYEHHFWLGATYVWLKQYRSALDSLREAIRLKPGDADSHQWLGDVYADGYTQYDEAIKEYRESIRLNPQFVIAYNRMGIVYARMDDPELAVPAFQEAIRLKPAEPLYLSNLGRTYFALGRKEDALAVQRKLQTLDPTRAKQLGDQIEKVFPATADSSAFLAELGQLMYDDPAGVLPVFRRVLLLNPKPEESAIAYKGLGDAFKARGRQRKAIAAYQQALPIYQRLVQLRPNDHYLLHRLGSTYVGLGQKDQAMLIYKRLQTLLPDLAKDLLKEINETK